MGGRNRDHRRRGADSPPAWSAAKLLGLARGWDGGAGPRALLACPNGELHDLGLICFGIALRGYGWRITYLGADTPGASPGRDRRPAGARHAIIVLAATRTPRLRVAARELRSSAVQVAVAGRGATRRIAEELGALLLDVDPVSAAAWVAADTR